MIDFDKDMEILSQVKQYELLFIELNDFYEKVNNNLINKENSKETFINILDNNDYKLLGKESLPLSSTLRNLNLYIPNNKKLTFNFRLDTFSKNISVLKNIIEDRFQEEFNKTSLYKLIKENSFNDDTEEYNNKLDYVLEHDQILKKYALGDKFRQNINYFLVTILAKSNNQISYKFIQQYSLSEDFLKKISKSRFQTDRLKDKPFIDVINKTILNDKLSSNLKDKKIKTKNKI